MKLAVEVVLRATLIAASVVFAFRGGPVRADGEHATATRTRSGLQLLYDFRSDDDDLVRDRSGVGEPLDLRITDPQAVRRTSGRLEIRGKTLIRSDKPAGKLIDAVRETGALTIEAWVHPARPDQSGPARILTLSKDSSARNFTLGQDGDRYDVRLRTTRTGGNGVPSLSSPAKSLSTGLTHVAYTRARGGVARIYLNGKQVAEKRVPGEIDNWDRNFQLALGNELSNDRPWLGTLHLVAVYSRDLRAGEIEQNYRAGADSEPGPNSLTAQAATPARTHSGLQLLYDFRSEDGATVRDRSGVGEPLDLRITDPQAVRQTSGGLEIRGKTLIRSEKPAAKLIEAVQATGALTVEAWVRPARPDQSGPARIITLSKDSGARNFTLGQEGDRYDVRLRTTGASTNGMPSLSSPGKSLTAELTHVAYTRSRGGIARMYLNGKEAGEKQIPGDMRNWDKGFRLGLGNELSNDRPWLGTLHLIAVYSRDLRPEEIQRNYRAGADGWSSREAPSVAQGSEGARLFNSHIATLFTQHCLECHDTLNKKGGLDLSRKAAALAGGENGKALHPGKAEESLLWQYVESNEMPLDREPLSSREKQLLRQWLDAGADWTVDVIDPAIYAHAGGASQDWLRRLTVSEYIETVRSTLGVDIAKEAREILPPDVRADGFSNTAYNLNVDLGHVEAYARLAETVVGRMDVEKFAASFAKGRDIKDDKMRDFVAEMGKWVLRGPLNETEVSVYAGIATTVGSAGGDFEEAVGYVIESMVQSPRFLYRIERQLGDGTVWPVDEYELASRISFIIWGGPPDEPLMRAAAEGRLYATEDIEAQVRRMLKDPRAIDRSLQFASEWLNLNRLNNLRPSPQRFPDWDPRLAADMREETLAYFKTVVWDEQRPLSDLLNAQFTFATPRLARHYRLKPGGKQSDKKNKGLTRYDLKSVPGRGGLLTHGSVLTVGGDDASMVTRGLFVLHDLLRGVVKDPPPCVDTTPVPSKPGRTQRAVAEARVANANCGGCHAKFEPLAYGLEKFDGIGAYYEQDRHGNSLREDGEILFPGSAKPIPYKSSAQLMDLLADSDRVRTTLTWKIAQFALGRPLGAADAPTMQVIHTQAQRDGGTYADVVQAIVLSDLVRTTRTQRRE